MTLPWRKTLQWLLRRQVFAAAQNVVVRARNRTKAGQHVALPKAVHAAVTLLFVSVPRYVNAPTAIDATTKRARPYSTIAAPLSFLTNFFINLVILPPKGWIYVGAAQRCNASQQICSSSPTRILATKMPAFRHKW